MKNLTPRRPGNHSTVLYLIYFVDGPVMINKQHVFKDDQVV